VGGYSFATTPGQLPKSVVPSRYVLAVHPDLKTSTFSGSETVQIGVKEATRTIVMNQVGLHIVTASVTAVTAGGTAAPVDAAIAADDGAQTVTLTLPTTLTPGDYTLQMAFTGRFSTTGGGLFATKYTDTRGKSDVMLLTQMESTDARRLFPAWDEPSFRARFQFTVTVPQDFMAVSNTDIVATRPAESGEKSVTFAETPPMASYLVVLAAGHLEAVSGKAAGVRLRVITTRGKSAQGRYALGVMRQILPYYNTYYGIDYPLPKLDLIAVPGIFNGAMENWGGVVYNEHVLLFDPRTSAEDDKQEIFNVVSHETAHQWTGDLVTMAWWDDLWLNEGFANWMASKATDHFNPAWHVREREVQVDSAAKDSDALATTHPVQQPVHDPEQADAAFDNITYDKGAAIVRMLEGYLGEDTFMQGMRAYMAAHQYSNATTADLWAALAQVSGKPVARIADAWTRQPGFPLICVRHDASSGTSKLVIDQQRYRQDASAGENDDGQSPPIWDVPISQARVTRDGLKQAEPLLLTAPSENVDTDADSDSALLLNMGSVGFYRVAYSPELFRSLRERYAALPAVDRAGLFDDTWSLTTTGSYSAGDYLDLARAAGLEKDPVLVAQQLENYQHLYGFMRNQPGRAAFQAYLRGVLAPRLARVGWDARPGESADIPSLRASLIDTLNQLDDPATIQEARKRFARHSQDAPATAPEVDRAILKVVGRHADQATYDTLHQLARTTKAPRERRRIYAALAAANDPALVQESLALAISPELVATPEIRLQILTTIAADTDYGPLAAAYFAEHEAALMTDVGNEERGFVVARFFQQMDDPGAADALLAYAKSHLPTQRMSRINRLVARMRSAAAFRARAIPQIDAWVAHVQK